MTFFFPLHCSAAVPGTVNRFRWVCVGLMFYSLLLKLYVTRVSSSTSWVRHCCLSWPAIHSRAASGTRRLKSRTKRCGCCSYGLCPWMCLRSLSRCLMPQMRLRARLLDLLKQPGCIARRANFSGGCNLYVPFAGIALLYLHLHDVYGDPAYLQVAHEYVKKSLSCLTKRSITFLCGDAGPLAVAAVVYHKLQNQKQSKDCITR